jgi:hypothetical protein
VLQHQLVQIHAWQALDPAIEHQVGTVRREYLDPFGRRGPCMHRRQHAEPVQCGQRVRDQRIAADLVAREIGLVDQHHVHAARSQRDGGGGPRGTGADHQHVAAVRHGGQVPMVFLAAGRPARAGSQPSKLSGESPFSMRIFCRFFTAARRRFAPIRCAGT